MEKLAKAIESTNDDIINELPSGHSSPIANTLVYHEIPNGFLVEFKNPVWSYLQYGTGIHGKYKGKGENGAIVPVGKKALHFKDMEIAAALGFKDENVFLKKVKGIKPRWFLERHYFSRKFMRKMS